MFSYRELTTTHDSERMFHIQSLLAGCGIACKIKAGNPLNPHPRHGIPGIKARYAYQYRIFVKKADYDTAVRALRGG